MQKQEEYIVEVLKYYAKARQRQNKQTLLTPADKKSLSGDTTETLSVVL